MEDHLLWIREVMSTTPDRWSSLVKSVPASLLTLKPAPNEWSALECLQHLVETESILRFRMGAFLEGKNIPAYNPDEQERDTEDFKSPAELAEEFSLAREATLVELVEVTAKDMERKVHHSELGFVKLGEMLNEWAAHDLMHTVQAERAMMQPFIQASGPWQSYFKDHVA